jgi:hypothetical protein
VPIIVVLFAVACADVTALLARVHRAAGAAAAMATIGIAAVIAARMDHRFFNTDHEGGKLGGVVVQTANVTSYLHAAEFLRQIVPPGGRLVTDYGGVFSCTTEGSLIEMWGLANATIATRGTTERINPIYGRTCPDCYRQLDPEYFHVVAPLVRPEPAFSSPAAVIANVWQTDTIGRTIHFESEFLVGKVVRPATHEALYFLQKRSTAASLAPRTTAAGFVVSYPFEAANFH